MQKSNIDKQIEVIKRGAVEIISEAELKTKLEESLKHNRPLKVKAGFDPTAPDIHLGHTVLLRKLRQFQDLGHQIIFLIGDFTARIGDPSGQNKARKVPTPKEIKANASTYKKQVFRILDSRKTKIVFNSSWFDKMSGLDFGTLLTHYTATRMLERDDFSQRIKEKKPIYMSEFIYPILQGYDSVKLEADIELGGADQIFNLLVGRDIQKGFGQAQQVVITMPLLEGTDGIQKMSKSYGNYIAINENPNEMFGKIMSVSDEMMFKYYTLLTDEDLGAVKTMHPKEAKLGLAEKIVCQYHGSNSAKKARQNFERIFTQRGLPEDASVYKLKENGVSLVDILMESSLIASRNEARRLIKQGGVSLDGRRLDKEDAIIDKEGILKVGKRRFLKLIKEK